MADDSSARVELRDVAIIGGGCYGTFYAGQLLRAAERGKAQFRRLLVVDRDPDCRFAREIGRAPDRELVVVDWGEFFDRWLDRPGGPEDGAGDAIVPSPLMPHLMYEWLIRRARGRWPGRPIEPRALTAPIGTPYDTTGADGTRYVSFADWLCPTHCIEPALCPAIGAPRTWEMGDAIHALADELRARGREVAGPALFVCRHRTFGVGMFSAAAVREGDRLVAQAGAAGEPAEILVGTISSCHGALNLLTLGRQSDA